MNFLKLKHLIIIFCVIFWSIYQSALAADQPIKWIDVKNYDSFAEAIEILGSTEATLLISDSQVVTTDITVPPNVTLWFIRGGAISVAANKTVIIQGAIEAGLFHIFKGDGKVLYESSQIPLNYPQWFGAKGNGHASDAIAFARAIDCSYGRILRIPCGVYYLTSGFTIRKNIVMQGDGAGSVLKFNTPENGFDIDLEGEHAYDYVKITGLRFASETAYPANFIKLTRHRQAVLEELYFQGNTAGFDSIAGVGIRNQSGYGLTINRCTWNWFEGTAILLEKNRFNDDHYSCVFRINQCDISNNKGAGIVIEGGNGNITDSIIESCSLGGIKVGAGAVAFPIKITGCYFETSSTQPWHIYLDYALLSNPEEPHHQVETFSFVTLDSCVFAGNTGGHYIVIKKKGRLNMKSCRGTAGDNTVIITADEPTTPTDQKTIWLDDCSGIALGTFTHYSYMHPKEKQVPLMFPFGVVLQTDNSNYAAAFTPSLKEFGGGSLSIGANGTVHGYYRKYNYMTIATVEVHFGTPSTGEHPYNASSGDWYFADFPVEIFLDTQSSTVTYVGSATLYDLTGDMNYTATAKVTKGERENSNIVTILSNATTGLGLSKTKPFTWDIGDVLIFTFTILTHY